MRKLSTSNKKSIQRLVKRTLEEEEKWLCRAIGEGCHFKKNPTRLNLLK